MADMVVAYWMPHNDGIEEGILDEPGQDTGITLVDLYECDGTIKTFATREEAEAWLAKRRHAYETGEDDEDDDG